MYIIPGLDLIDIKILMLLQENADMPVKQIAIKINRSVSATHQRIMALKSSGIIKSFSALLDLTKFEQILITYTFVKLNDHSATALNNFREAICNFDEVMECCHITGDFDFLLKVVTTGTAAYYDFSSTKLGHIPHLGDVWSSMVLAEHKHVTAYKLSQDVTHKK